MRCAPGLLGRVPHKKLSGSFTAIDIDLQQRVDSLSGFPEAHLPDILWESDNTLKVLATSTGRWNAVVFWFKVSKCMHTNLCHDCTFDHKKLTNRQP